MRISRAGVQNVASRRIKSCHEDPRLRVFRRRGRRSRQVGVRMTRGFMVQFAAASDNRNRRPRRITVGDTRSLFT